ALGALVALSEPHVEQVREAGFVVRKEAEELGGSEGLRVHAPFYSLSDYVWQGDTPQKDWLDHSGRSLPLSRLASASSIEELVREAIDEELYQFSRGSHEDQEKYIRSSFGINISGKWKRWPDYIEIF